MRNDMAKQVSLNMWVSVIPNEMHDGWVKRKFIPRRAWDICETDSKDRQGWVEVLDKKDEKRTCVKKEAAKEMKKQGWKRVYERYQVDEQTMDIIHKEVSLWYKEVFDYVNMWLRKHKFIDLEKGSFDGGFCAVPNEDETTKGWGAPLARRENKVVQIKEKFGRITVYFGGLTDKERAKIDRFEKAVSKKFDCSCVFC
jgi:hypothetical protein